MAMGHSTTDYSSLSLGDPGVQEAKVQSCWAPKQDIPLSKDWEEQSPQYINI